MGWFKRKKKPYVPQGRVGYWRKDYYPWHYIVIFEEVGKIGNRSQVKVLKVDVYRSCSKTEAQCLKNMGGSNFILSTEITWETEEQKDVRLNEHSTFLVDGETTQPTNPDLRPYTDRYLTPHSFTNNNEDDV